MSSFLVKIKIANDFFINGEEYELASYYEDEKGGPDIIQPEKKNMKILFKRFQNKEISDDYDISKISFREAGIEQPGSFSITMLLTIKNRNYNYQQFEELIITWIQRVTTTDGFDIMVVPSEIEIRYVEKTATAA